MSKKKDLRGVQPEVHRVPRVGQLRLSSTSTVFQDGTGGSSEDSQSGPTETEYPAHRGGDQSA